MGDDQLFQSPRKFPASWKLRVGDTINRTLRLQDSVRRCTPEWLAFKRAVDPEFRQIADRLKARLAAQSTPDRVRRMVRHVRAALAAMVVVVVRMTAIPDLTVSPCPAAPVEPRPLQDQLVGALVVGPAPPPCRVALAV